MSIVRYRRPNNANMAVDLIEAQRFLDILGQDEKFAFQAYDDNPSRELKDHKLSQTGYGTLKENAAWLTRANQQHAAVLVAINRTDGRGRKKENIEAVRAVSVDLDGAPLDPVKACPLKAHVIVETSKGRFHAIWRVEGLPPEKFAAVQWAIAKRFDGDSAIAKLTHCERVPGFFHCKDIENRFRVRIVEANDAPPYSAAQIIGEFPPETKPHKSGRSTVLLPKGNPTAAAEAYVTAQFNQDSVRTIHRHRGAFFTWRGSHYQSRDEGHIRRSLYEFLHRAEVFGKDGVEPFNPTKFKVDQIFDVIRAATDLDAEWDAPFWITEPAGGQDVPENSIVFRNGVLDLETRELRPHDPRMFNINALAYDYDNTAPPPTRWLQFLAELFPADRDAVATLQEIAGLLLTGDTSYQKIFLLVGPKRSGKGTIGHVFTGLVGRQNAASPTMASLGAQFGLWPLIDKRLAIVPDARLDGRESRKTVENLLSISGEDALTIDRKYQGHWTGRLAVRFLILTNELPRFADASGALASRFVILSLMNSFYGKEDLALKDKLFAELPGILNWALEGLDRLRKRGRFEMPESSRSALRQMEDLASPVGAFVRDVCVVGPNLRVEKASLYGAWQRWCEGQGERPGSARVFGRNLTAAFSTVRPGHSSSTKLYIGIALKDDEDLNSGFRAQRYGASTDEERAEESGEPREESGEED